MTKLQLGMRQLSDDQVQYHSKINPYVLKARQFEPWLLIEPNSQQFQANFKKLTNQRQVHVDLGCGSGLYLFEQCKNNPQLMGFGFETRFKRLSIAAKKFKDFQLNNGLFLRELGQNLPDYFPPKSIDCVSINFPDPWPKKRHHKKRLLKTKFLQQLAPLMTKQGVLSFKTDHHNYFAEFIMLVQSLELAPYWQVTRQTNHLQQSNWYHENIDTEFERLFRSKNNPPIAYAMLQVKQ